MPSKNAQEIEALLKQVFPHSKIQSELYVNYKHQKLYVDFYIPDYKIGIEVHGRQHDEFVPHFHGDAAGWAAHRRRDNLKLEWAEENKITLVVIREKDIPKNKEDFLNLIWSETYGGD